jgi:hypothetical protein
VRGRCDQEAFAPLSSLLEDLSTRLAAIESHVGLPVGGGGGAPAGAGSGAVAAKKKAAAPLAPQVLALDALAAGALAAFLTAASAVGGKAAELVRKGWQGGCPVARAVTHTAGPMC